MVSTTVDPTDRDRHRDALASFAPTVTERGDGTLVAEFANAHFAVEPDGTVDAGMPLHDFDGPAERLAFDDGAIEVQFGAGDDAFSYTFRRP